MHLQVNREQRASRLAIAPNTKPVVGGNNLLGWHLLYCVGRQHRGRCGSLASTCGFLIQYKKFFNSNNETNQCFVLHQTCIKSYLSTAAVRSVGSRIGSPVLKTRMISRKPAHCMYGRYRLSQRYGWCVRLV